MSLKTMQLAAKIENRKAALTALSEKDEGFAKWEAELEQAIVEAKDAEQEQFVASEVDKFTGEKDAHEESKAALQREIEDLETQLADEEQTQKEKMERARPEGSQRAEAKTERKGTNMNTREKFFGMSMAERDAFFANSEVKDFLQRARDMGREKRAINGKELLIPTIVLDVLRENVINYSKLYRHINVRFVPGNARMPVMGAIPEGVWTEMCATLNELTLTFNGVEVQGYKVGGYIAVCNAVLEDSDIALASEIISALGQAIGIALDKAILYGTGTRMPLGILPRLAQTAAPAGADPNALPWKDLSKTNIIPITGQTGAGLFKAIVTASGAAKGKYSRGVKFWAMSESTYTMLIAEALTINAAGSIVAGIQGIMPVVGGDIEVLSFIPDGVIIGGYGDLYLLVERAGTSIRYSEDVRFIEDQTVFKGTARYDGLPVIAEAFVAIDINGNTPSPTAVTFTPDTANEPAAAAKVSTQSAKE